MNCCFDQSLAANYHSRPQQIRAMSEGWVAAHISCPACGGALRPYENNRPAADFCCPHCGEDFELKSSAAPWGGKIMDGAYVTMLERIASERNPNFFFLHYSAGDYCVNNLFCVPKQFFTAEIIEKRKPLSPQARRAGWVGCNILAEKLPESGKIFYLKNGQWAKAAEIRADFARTGFLRQSPLSRRGWLLDVMKQIEALGRRQFTLAEIYGRADYLQKLHPENSHIQAKIRQQLQFLRDKGYLRFLRPGVYELS